MMMKKMVSLLIVVSFFMSGCASMFHGTKETIYVRSEEPNTAFFAGARDIGKGTSAVTVLPKKGLGDVVLRAEKAGCNTKSMPIETQFDAISLLGILLDYGIISILLVDWGVNGATTKASQTDYVLTPDCSK